MGRAVPNESTSADPEIYPSEPGLAVGVPRAKRMQRVGYIVARTAVVAFGIALLAGVPPAMLFAETAAECTGAPGRDFRPINIGLFSNGVPASSEMPTGSHEIATPFGFISFCMRNPDQCADPSGQPQIVHLDEGTWKT